MKKRVIALILSVLLTLSLAACGNPDRGSSSQSSEGGSSVAQDESSSSTSSESNSESESNPESEEAYEITYSNAMVYTNSIGTTWVQVITEIENTGTADLYFSSGSYDLEDENGKLVASSSMTSTYPQVISPGEKAYMYEETTLDNPVEGKLTVLPRPKAKKATVENIRYSVTDVELAEDDISGLEALGRVENTAEEAGSMVYIVLILKDSAGIPIGQMFTILTDDLNPGDKIGFKASDFAMPETVTKDAVASFDVFAYPMQMQF